MRLVTCVAALAIVSAAPAAAQHPTIALVHRIDSLWGKQDTVGLKKLYDPSYIYFSSKGDTRRLPWMLKLVADTGYVLTKQVRSEVEAVASGGTVVVSTRWVGQGRYRTFKIDDDQRCSLTFTQKGASWVVLSEHCTQIERSSS